jgi:predicted Zn finger-like uncharacterized protein
MIVTCPNCSANLQLDAAKIPSRQFTVRCPKCQFIINVPAPADAGDRGALEAGNSPALSHSRFERAAPAPAFKPGTGDEKVTEPPAAAPPATGEADTLARSLAALLQRSLATATDASTGSPRLSWEPRRALICVVPTHRNTVARKLTENRYEVFVADDTTQAIERMREDRMDVVVLDLEFDSAEQGATFIKREIMVLRPSERRRIFFVLLSPSMRTADSHAAFINHVNLVINPTDIESLPSVLQRAIRDFNDLYRDFNKALNVAAI